MAGVFAVAGWPLRGALAAVAVVLSGPLAAGQAVDAIAARATAMRTIETIRVDAGLTNQMLRLAIQGPVLGRIFTDDEETRKERLVVLSHGAWQRRFGGDPGIVVSIPRGETRGRLLCRAIASSVQTMRIWTCAYRAICLSIAPGRAVARS